MLRALILVAVALALFPALILASDLCEWHMGPSGPTFSSGGPAASLQSTDCMELDSSSVIWLRSDGCVCVADVRIIGSYRACDSVQPTTVGSDDSACDYFSWSHSIIGWSSSNGNMIGEWEQGSSANYPPLPVVYEEAQVVPCGDTFAFAMLSDCECQRHVSRAVVETVVDPFSGASSNIATIETSLETVCGSPGNNGSFRADCLNDCGIGYEAANIPIEVQSP